MKLEDFAIAMPVASMPPPDWARRLAEVPVLPLRWPAAAPWTVVACLGPPVPMEAWRLAVALPREAFPPDVLAAWDRETEERRAWERSNARAFALGLGITLAPLLQRRW